jgi:hypothetical protein
MFEAFKDDRDPMESISTLLMKLAWLSGLCDLSFLA